MKLPPIEIPGEGLLYARLKINVGDVIIRLEEKRAPNMVANFVGLATGRIAWTDPLTGKKTKAQPFYDGLRIHRVVRNFVVQMGDPWTRHPEHPKKWGTGTPGYSVRDEFHPELRHNRAGVVSMANKGDPDTNGCQFFITEVPTPHLDNRHSVFGLVTAGQDTVKAIANTRTGDKDRPTSELLIESVSIYRQ